MPYYDVTQTNMLRQNALWLCQNQRCEYMAGNHTQTLRSGLGCSRSIPQVCAAGSASLEVSRRSAQGFQKLQNFNIL